MRPILVLLHRWCGLFIALFLFTAGLTGAVISWDHELDEWLNPHLFDAQSAGPAQDPLQLVDALEASDPRLQVSFMPLALEPGHALGIFVDPRIDPATGKAFDLGFNQLGIDPVNGDIQGQREWGAISLSRENLLPFLYKLHYSLHIPDGFGIELGVLFFGIVAIVWCLDCLVALWLSFPNLRSWRKSFAFRWRQGGYKLNFDLHRSGGVWIWLLLLILAVTSVSMNLERQVVRPLVELFSPLTPSPFASRTPVTLDQQIVPQIDRRQAIAIADAEARRLGWDAPPVGCSTRRSSACMALASTRRARITAMRGWAIPGSTSTAAVVSWPVRMCRAPAVPGISSCRRNSRCTRAHHRFAGADSGVVAGPGCCGLVRDRRSDLGQETSFARARRTASARRLTGRGVNAALRPDRLAP
ncbi:PepSY domain-containing protein [Pseudomonas sp. MDMC_285]|nr:PepSY domain-containing protein [Pseudomonas sp. MDMC_285]